MIRKHDLLLEVCTPIDAHTSLKGQPGNSLTKSIEGVAGNLKMKHLHSLISRWRDKRISMRVGTLKQSLYNERKAIAPKNIFRAANFAST